jgi:hypothetical protein
MRSEDRLAKQQAYWELKANNDELLSVKDSMTDPPNAIIRPASGSSHLKPGRSELGDFKITEAVRGIVNSDRLSSAQEKRALQFRVKANFPRQTGPVTSEYREKYTEKPLGMPRPIKTSSALTTDRHPVSIAVDTNSAPVHLPYVPQTEYRSEYVERPLEQRSVGTGTPAGLPRNTPPSAPPTSSTGVDKPVSEYAAQYKAYPLPRTRTVAVANPYVELESAVVVEDTEPRLSEYARQYQWFGPLPSERTAAKTVSTGVEEIDLEENAAPRAHEPFPKSEYQAQFSFVVPPREAFAHESADHATETTATAPEPLKAWPLRTEHKFDAVTEYQDRYRKWSADPVPRAVRKVNVGDAGQTIKVTHEFDPSEASSQPPATQPSVPLHNQMSYQTEYSARYVDPSSIPQRVVAPVVEPSYSEPQHGGSDHHIQFTDQDVARYQGWLEQLRELRERAHSYKVRDRKAAVEMRLSSLAREQLQILQRTRDHGRHVNSTAQPAAAGTSPSHRATGHPAVQSKHTVHHRFPEPVSADTRLASHTGADSGSADLLVSSFNQRAQQHEEMRSEATETTHETSSHAQTYHSDLYAPRVCDCSSLFSSDSFRQENKLLLSH